MLTLASRQSSQQFIDQQVYGGPPPSASIAAPRVENLTLFVPVVTGSGVGAFIVRPGNAYETSSGGPFFRDIAIQGSDQQEITAYIK